MNSLEKYRRIFWVIIPAVLIIISIQVAVGIYLYKTQKFVPKKLAVIELAAPQSSEAEATPEPTDAAADYKNLKVQIQNGRGVAGTAGAAQEFLEGIGYGDIETGNADSFDYPLTIVLLKQSNTKYFDSIKKDLSDGYVVDEQLQDLSEGESEFDIVIIIGLE